MRQAGPRAEPTRPLGQRLVDAALVTSDQVDAALRSQRLVRGRLGYHLLRLGFLGPVELSDFLEREIEDGRLPGLEPPAGPPGLAVLPARLAQLYNVYPLRVGAGRLELAVPPAAGQAVVEAVSACTGRLVEPCVLPARVLRLAVERDYLGGTEATVLPSLSGLATLVVDDELRHARPLAPDLRTPDLSAEAWLRSLVGEALAARTRVIELRGEGLARDAVAVVGGGACHPVAAPLHAPLHDLVARLAGLDRDPQREQVGAFQLLARGRRLVVTVKSAPPADLRMVLADQRLATEDPDELFAEASTVQDGIERFVEDRTGLLLCAGPAGGGARRVARVLSARLAEVVPDAVRIADTAGTGRATTAAGDEATAQALHDAAEKGSSLLLVDELPGPRSVERALLVAGRRRVVAVLSAADAAAALAWLSHQGLAGALKTGLLRAIVSVLGVEEACACAARIALPPWLRERFALADVPALPWNAGCERCLESPVRRPHAVMTWTQVAGSPSEAIVVADETAARVAARACGGTTTLDLAIARALAGRGEVGGAVRLLAPPMS